MIPGNLGSGGFSQPRNRRPEDGDPGGQLYNLDHDIAEENNLWDEHTDVAERLRQRLRQIREQGRMR